MAMMETLESKKWRLGKSAGDICFLLNRSIANSPMPVIFKTEFVHAWIALLKFWPWNKIKDQVQTKGVMPFKINLVGNFFLLILAI